MARKTILGLDVGSNSIKAVLAEVNAEGKTVLLWARAAQSKGIRRGVVVDMDAASQSIKEILDSAREVSKNAGANIYLNIGGADVKSQISKGGVAVARANSEIHRNDIDRVVEASLAVNLPSNRVIVHTINREFVVDGIQVENALGMTGAKLEVVTYLIDAFKPSVDNLSKCVKLAGGEVAGLMFNPLSSAQSVLTANQKELGIVLVDIGYATTGIAVYEEGKLMHTCMLRIGAGDITNDLAMALQIPVEVAERIKLSYGYAISSSVSGRESVDLKKIDSNLKGSPSKKYISNVIELRLADICTAINKQLKSIQREAKLPGGVVIVGGGAKLPGVAELFRTELKMTAKIGLPSAMAFESTSSETAEALESPEYASALGLIMWGVGERPKQESWNEAPVMNIIGKIVNYLKNFLP